MLTLIQGMAYLILMSIVKRQNLDTVKYHYYHD